MKLTAKLVKSEQTLLIKRLSAFSFAVKREVREVVSKSGKAIQKNAKSRAPRATGALRRNIRFSSDNDGLTGFVFVAPRAYYGHLVEFGTGSRYRTPPGVSGRGGASYTPGVKGGLAKWAKKKNLPIFPVIRGIARRGGTPRRPFLYPAFQGEKRGYERNIKRAIMVRAPRRVA